MKSASQMSLEIRAKKKAMQADPAIIDLSGVSMDKTDEDIMQANEMTSDLGLDTNIPKMRSEAPSMSDKEDAENPKPETMAPDPEQDEMKSKRMARLSKMMR